MILTDEEAFICDFAEYYHIFNYRELPVKLLATLAVGLRANSRIKLKINEQQCSSDTWLLATIVDRLAILTNMLSGNKQKPILLTQMLNGKEESKEITSFDSAEEFEKMRAKILGKE